MFMKNLVKVAFLTASILVAGYSVSVSQRTDSMSALMLANVEALARYELPDVEVTCNSNPGRCWILSGMVCIRYGKTWQDCERVSNTNAHCSTPCD